MNKRWEKNWGGICDHKHVSYIKIKVVWRRLLYRKLLDNLVHLAGSYRESVEVCAWQCSNVEVVAILSVTCSSPHSVPLTAFTLRFRRPFVLGDEYFASSILFVAFQTFELLALFCKLLARWSVTKRTLWIAKCAFFDLFFCRLLFHLEHVWSIYISKHKVWVFQ